MEAQAVLSVKASLLLLALTLAQPDVQSVVASVAALAKVKQIIIHFYTLIFVKKGH